MNVDWERVLTGPNVWSERPVWEMCFTESPALPDADVVRCRQWVCERLAAAGELLSSCEQSCVESPAWSRTPARPAAFLAWATVEWQRLLGARVERSWFEPVSENRVLIAVEFEEEPLARACWETVIHWWTAACEQRSPEPIEGEVGRLQQFAFDVCVGMTTRAMMDAAKAQGLPVRRLEHESLIQLSYGARGRRLLTSLTDRAASVAEKISDDKWLTKSLLRGAGMPVAPGQLVRDADDAWRAAEELGLPVVVKPRDDDYGHGVSLHLTTETAVREAYTFAKTFKPDILVERHASGVHHRLFVMHDRVVAAVRRDPAQVIGDGTRTVAELVEEANRDPRRIDEDPLAPMCRITLGPEEQGVLADQGLTPESLPTAGHRVPLRYDSRTFYGGTNVDCTEQVHPEFATLAADAVRLIGLDVAGVDLLADDIARSPANQSVTLLEINAAPSIVLHIAPLNESPRPICELLIDELFPTPESREFPIVVLTESPEASGFARRLARSWPNEPRTIGVSCAEGVWVGETSLTCHGATNADTARALLWHPRAEAAICELSWNSLRAKGLPFEQCSVAVFLEHGRVSQEAEKLESLLAEHTCDAVVVNVDDAHLAEWADSRDKVLPVSRDEQHPAVTRARERAGRAVFCRDDDICLAEGSQEWRLTGPDVNIADVTTLLALAATMWVLSRSVEDTRLCWQREWSQSSNNSPPVREGGLVEPRPRPTTPVAA